jgi:acyl-[acyl-carrier-protein]-phospholipid O-acyltransferase/long-chain-fatty-acid--[acyl-carrier-protein] ligase
VRLVLWLLTHTLYRIRVVGSDNMPAKGGVLLACNHLSFVDAMLLLASCERPIRFIIHKDIYRLVWVRPFARLLGCIPIAAQMRPRELLHALSTAAEAIRAGDVVCIFGEGQISRIGQLLPFARGMERIMRGQEAPIVPACLDGVWGSLFSFSRRRFFWKLPERPLEPVTVCYGPPLPATTPAFEVRQAVQQLMTDAWMRRSQRFPTLSTALLRSARRHPLRLAMADSRTPPLRFAAALARTIFLARRLAPTWAGQDKVGILLPPSVAGALVNHAALLMGKVPVNLNYTASAEVLAACARRCGLTNIVTSQALLDRVRVELPVPAVLIEDLAAAPRRSERVAALLLALLAPAWLLRRVLRVARRTQPDDLATIIFSSGSTGDPKGVMLSHANIASNVQQFAQTFALGRHDRVMGVLPFFHSFGFTATLALPARLGIGVIYHANPLDAQTIGELVERYAATFLLATPTFLQTYAKRCAPDELGSLEYVLAGAEKLPERIAQAFEDQFGLRPLEGYGLTECSPCVCVNTRDFRARGFRQRGAKRGTIGLPLPGVSVRVVDPETMAPVPMGTAGMLLVRGPNVMLGYLGDPEKTAEVLWDGWYVTGDIAAIDEDGFVQITDRLSRFSKIGGEMVPHVKVEDTLHELAGSMERAFAVAGVPDSKRGERLVVLHTLSDEALARVLAQLPTSGLPNLWLPRAEDFHRVESFPVLGTGKLDLRGVRGAALALTGA